LSNAPNGTSLNVTLGIGQHTVSTRENKYDFVHVRKWSPPQPTFAIGAEEANVPIVAFTCTPRAGVRNATITLTDESTETPTGRLWWAPSTGIPCHNNVTLEVTNQNPAVFPKNFGYCGICLTATNADGSGSLCKPNYLYIAQPQVAIT
jgi:PKD repeat protein